MGRPKAEACTDVPFLEELLAEAMKRAFGGEDEEGNRFDPERGIAGMRALELCASFKRDLDNARELARAGEDMDEGEMLAALTEEAHAMADVHLRVMVEEWCKRRGVGIPGVIDLAAARRG